MKTRAEFWSAVDAELDARRDPLRFESMRAWVLEHPEDALALGDLQLALGAVERADNPLCAPRRARRVPIAAAALALVGLGAWLALPSRTAAEELELHPIVAAPELGSVQSWVVISTSETAETTQTVRTSEGRIATEDDYRAAGDTLAQAIVLATCAESWSAQ